MIAAVDMTGADSCAARSARNGEWHRGRLFPGPRRTPEASEPQPIPMLVEEVDIFGRDLAGNEMPPAIARRHRARRPHHAEHGRRAGGAGRACGAAARRSRHPAQVYRAIDRRMPDPSVELGEALLGRGAAGLAALENSLRFGAARTEALPPPCFLAIEVIARCGRLQAIEPRNRCSRSRCASRKASYSCSVSINCRMRLPSNRLKSGNYPLSI